MEHSIELEERECEGCCNRFRVMCGSQQYRCSSLCVGQKTLFQSNRSRAKELRPNEVVIIKIGHKTFKPKYGWRSTNYETNMKGRSDD